MKLKIFFSLIFIVFAGLQVMAEGDTKPPKKIVFAHYMGCFPLDKFNSNLDRVNHNLHGYENAIGGRYITMFK